MMNIKEFAVNAGISQAKARKVASRIGGTRTGKIIAGKPSIVLPDNAVELYLAMEAEPPPPADNQEKQEPAPPGEKKNTAADSWNGSSVDDILNRYGLVDDTPDPEQTGEPAQSDPADTEGMATLLDGLMTAGKVKTEENEALSILWCNTVAGLLTENGVNTVYAKILIVVAGGAILFIPAVKRWKSPPPNNPGSLRKREDEPGAPSGVRVEW